MKTSAGSDVHHGRVGPQRHWHSMHFFEGGKPRQPDTTLGRTIRKSDCGIACLWRRKRNVSLDLGPYHANRVTQKWNFRCYRHSGFFQPVACGEGFDLHDWAGDRNWLSTKQCFKHIIYKFENKYEHFMVVPFIPARNSTIPTTTTPILSYQSVIGQAR